MSLSNSSLPDSGLGAGASVPALVIGFADCVAEDVLAAEALFPKHVKFGVNRAVLHFKCDHLISIDRNFIPNWLPDYPITVHAGRVGGIRNDWPRSKYPWVDMWWPEHHTGGSSAWLAVKIAISLGHSPVALCGCPIDDSPHLVPDPRCNAWVENPKQARSCREVIMRETEHHVHVRSMSGWTKELFGAP